MTFRTTLAAAAALIALGAAPAFAQSGGAGGDSNINNFVRQSPNGMQPQSNGVPRIVDNREGQPVISYDGSTGPVRGARQQRGRQVAGTTQAQMPMGPMLGRARTAIQRGQFGAASASLEAAETRLLNQHGGAADNATLRSISEARAASNRRDRAGALRSLDAATQSMGRAG